MKRSDNTKEIINYFKEDIIDSVIEIPYEEEDILNVVDIIADIKVESYKFKKIEKAVSNEGNIITGNTLLVEVFIKEKISYDSYDNKKGLCIFFNETIKSFSIALPQILNGKDIESIIRAKRFNILPKIEDNIYRKINNRKIHNSMLILVDVKLF